MASDLQSKDKIYKIAHRGTVIFRVQDQLYKLNQDRFMISEVFGTMFSLPCPSEGAEGQTPDRPINLSGITADAFEAFISVLFTYALDELPALTAEQWADVLQLATMWQFDRICSLATDEIGKKNIGSDPILAIRLGRKCHIQKWVDIGFLHLAVRDKPLTIAEAEFLGLETLIKLMDAREAALKCNHCGSSGCEPKHARKGYEQLMEWGEDDSTYKFVQGILVQRGLYSGNPVVKAESP